MPVDILCVENKKKKTVLLQLGVNPVYSTIKNTLGNQLIEFAGGQNVFNLTGNGAVTREDVILKNPDVIIITNMGIVSTDEKKRWENFGEITAVKDRAIYLVDSHAVCSPDPLIFVKTVINISKLIFKN